MRNFTPTLQKQFEDRVSEKLEKLIKEKGAGLNKMLEQLERRGMDIIYTLVTRSDEDFSALPDKGLDKLTEQAVEIVGLEIDGIASTIAIGSTQKKGRAFKKAKNINAVKAGPGDNIRDSAGRFMSAMKLATLLNIMIKIKAAEIMKTLSHGNTLNFRTGRLANSGNVTTVNLKTKSIYLSYMTYPYQVFERNGKKWKPGRDPRDIFSHALAEALSQLISKKDLATTRFGVYVGRNKHGNIALGEFS